MNGSPQTRGRLRGREVGFTLIEIMLVLVIGVASYLLLLGVPFRGTSSAELKAAARSLAAGLRQAQTIAMTSKRDTALTLDLDSREFTVTGDATIREVAKGLELKLYTAQSEVTSEKRGAIRFYPDGSSTGGRITVASGERKYLVDVDWLTGRVAITD